MKRIIITIVLFTLALSACAVQAPAAKAGPIEILNPWVKAAANGENTAAFMIVKNTGSPTDKLIKAEFNGAMETEIHETKMSNDVMEMSPIDALEIPANGQVELKSGSYHVMMMGLNKELKAGDKVDLTLTFANAGSVTVTAEVRNP
jgi:periplasmic copper chaperone A